ncbi:reverse transcriptase domain-containing protein [Mesorhizobium sp. M0991]|uniref:reverse transcriptase domain-containing protein n=1 Tax=Mesorhizobium sp. M0991 TaxID=2957043 RepID=UPI0033382ACB
MESSGRWRLPLEDKIVQGATVMVLNAIYEGDFCGFSYGFRPGRGSHDALDALCVAINTRRVNWIVDADIQNFFGSVSQDWLVRFLEHRIGDKRIIRLIRLAEGGHSRRRDRDGR